MAHLPGMLGNGLRIALIFSLSVLTVISARGSDCVGIYSTNGSGQIRYYNPVSDTHITVGTYSSTNINGLAVNPSGGELFFVNRATFKVIKYNITTGVFTTLSGTLPSGAATLGNVVGATFNSAGNLLVMYELFRLVEVNPLTGSQIGSTITITGIPGDGLSPNGTNGDIVIDSTGQIWIVGSSSSTNYRLYTLSISGTTATATAATPNLTGISGSVQGLAIDPATGTFYISTGTGGTYTVNLSTGAATRRSTTIANDLGSCGAAPAPPVISKAFSPASATSVPATSTLTITVGNANGVMDFLTSNLIDTLPSGMIVATPSGLTGTCTTITGNTITATAGTGTITFNSGGRIPAGGCTITATVSVTGTGSYANTIAVAAYKTLAGSNSAAAGATFTASSPPSLALNKSVTPTGSQPPGTDLSYTIAFTNSGGSAASVLMIVDPVPANTDFKIGSASVSPGSTGLTFVIEFSSDYTAASPGSATWVYTPASGGGGASAGYDRNVKAVRWRVTAGNLSQSSPANTGNVGFTVKIR